MLHISDLFSVVFSAALSWLLVWVLTPFLRIRLLDLPNERSSHCLPTPRGGGAAFVAVSTVASFFALLDTSSYTSTSFSLILGPLIALPLALVGFLDDRNDLPASWRYVAQLSTAIAVVLYCPLFTPTFKLLPFILFLLISVTAVINFTNFMDGLDGLVAGCIAVAIASAALRLAAPWPIWSLIGALLGFLFSNWSPAKVFMGDVGSTFLGAVFAFLVLQSPNWSEAFALLLVATPLLGDAFFCVPRRLFAGQQVFSAHRLHLFQRLHQAGWSHARVSSLYIFATIALSIAFLWGGTSWVISLAFIVLLTGIWLDQRVAVPFTVALRK